MVLMLCSLNCFANGFFEERYQGWLWFEEKEKMEYQKKLDLQKQQEKLKKAREEVEQFTRELENLRFLMIRYPKNLEYVREYKQKEAIMLDKAMDLANSWRKVNFLHPEDVDAIENPLNLYGRRIKEEIVLNDNEVKVKNLAQNVELFLFFSESCKYCQQLQPVLASFAKQYGFKVEAVSVDGSISKYFNTHTDRSIVEKLVQKLDLQKIPTVVAVTHDSQVRFELIRGAASTSELLEASVMGYEYLLEGK